MINRHWLIKGLCFGLLLVAGILCLTGCTEALTMELLPAEGEVRVSYLDVGQGDAACIQTSDGSTMVIDTGTSQSKETMVADLQALGVTNIDYLVLTHAHADHIGGAQAIISAFPVTHALISPQPASTKTYTKTLTALDNAGTEVIIPNVGDTYTLGDCSILCLGPAQQEYSDLNDSSIILKLAHGSDTFMFTGDMEELAEQQVMATGADLSTTVLKVAHHGSSSSSSEAWLNALGGVQAAIISAGAGNDYGLPTPETLNRLAAHGIPVYRTDEHGIITVTSSGSGITVVPSR